MPVLENKEVNNTEYIISLLKGIALLGKSCRQLTLRTNRLCFQYLGFSKDVLLKVKDVKKDDEDEEDEEEPYQ